MLRFLPTPSARRATQRLMYSSTLSRFLPTPSARRATWGCCWLQRGVPYFYPRPPRGGRRALPQKPSHRPPYFYPRPPRGGRQRDQPLQPGQPAISTHALREEGDVVTIELNWQIAQFLPTPSARRATGRHRGRHPVRHHFYPRPPRGGRRWDTCSHSRQT